MILVQNLSKRYQLGKDNFVQALQDISFEIPEQSVNALIGPSGSGKSTLINIIGGLDRDYEGEVMVEEKEIRKYNPNTYRRKYVQTVFQRFYLVPNLSVFENVALPLKFGGQYKGGAMKERVEKILDEVGLSDRMHHEPNELSGGQAQRVAIARALVSNPKIILADEPTGNLDSKTGKQIIDLLYDINEKEEKTIIIISHDPNVIGRVERQFHLLDGKLVTNNK